MSQKLCSWIFLFIIFVYPMTEQLYAQEEDSLSIDSYYSKLIYAPNARPLPKGKGYFANYYFLHSVLAYGVTDRITVMGGFSVPMPYTPIMYYFAPKIEVARRDKLVVSTGVLLHHINDRSSVMGYVIGTYGEPDRSFTIGVGSGYQYEDFGQSRSTFAENPVLILGGNYRLSKHTALVSENQIFGGEGLDIDFLSQISIFAIRVFRRRNSFDLGIGALRIEPGDYRSFLYFSFDSNFRK